MRPAMQNNMDKEEAPIEEDDNFPYPSLNWFLFIVSLVGSLDRIQVLLAWLKNSALYCKITDFPH